MSSDKSSLSKLTRSFTILLLTAQAYSYYSNRFLLLKWILTYLLAQDLFKSLLHVKACCRQMLAAGFPAACLGKGLLQVLAKACYRHWQRLTGKACRLSLLAAGTGRGTRMDRYLIFIHNYLKQLTSS